MSINGFTLTIKQLYAANPGSAADRYAIGSVLEAVALYTTDLPLDAAQPGTYYYRQGLWVKPGQQLQFPSSAPPDEPYYAFNYPTAPATGTWYPMNYVGTADLQNGVAEIRFINNTVFSETWIEVRHRFVVLQDSDGYRTGSGTSSSSAARRALLFDSRSNSTELSVVSSSAYGSTTSEQAAALFFLPVNTDPVASPNPWQVGEVRVNQQPRFYGRDVGNTDLTVITNFSEAIQRPFGQPVTDLSLSDATFARVNFDAASAVNWVELDVWLIRTDTNAGSNTTYLQNYEHEIGRITDENGNTFLGNNAQPAWLQGTANRLRGPSRKPYQLPSGQWESNFVIDPGGLQQGARYRLVYVLYYSDNANPTTDANWQSVSFIGQELRTESTPGLCPPEVESELLDYKTLFTGSNLTVSPQERISSRVRFFGDAYDSCKEFGSFLNNLSAVQVRVYTETTPPGTSNVYKNIMQEYNLPVNIAGAFQNNSPDVTAVRDFAANTLAAGLDFRVRYEDNEPCLYSINQQGQQAPQPLDTQDWTNKRVWVEYRLTISHTQPAPYTETLVFKHYIEVHGYDEDCLEIEFLNEDGNPLVVLCDTTEQFTVRVTSCEPGAYDFIGLVDGPNVFSINNITENESWIGVLDQLQEQPIISIDPDFTGPGNTAEAVIDATQLNIGQQYRFVAIRKGQPSQVVPCGGGQLNRVGVSTEEISVGDTTQGPFIIVYDTFSGADDVTLWEGAGGTGTGAPIWASPNGNFPAKKMAWQGLIVEPANVQTLDMRVQSTQWFYANFCAQDPGLPCGQWYEFLTWGTGPNGIGSSNPNYVPNDPNSVPLFKTTDALLLAVPSTVQQTSLIRIYYEVKYSNPVGPNGQQTPQPALSAFAVSGGTINVWDYLRQQSPPNVVPPPTVGGYTVIWDDPNSIPLPASQAYNEPQYPLLPLSAPDGVLSGFFTVQVEPNDRVALISTAAPKLIDTVVEHRYLVSCEAFPV